MDDIESGVLLGSLPGSLNGGAQLVTGRHGNALYTDHSSSFDYVTYALDSNHRCLQNPSWCDSGVTFSMWLMNLPGNAGGYFTVLNSVGCSTWGIGFCGGIDHRFWLKFYDDFWGYRYRIPAFDVGKWQHIVFTFKPNEGINLYMNGCDTIAYRIKEGYELVSPHNPYPGTKSSSLRFGGGSRYAAHMLLDHVLIWYDVLNVTEIWQLYLNNDMVWRNTDHIHIILHRL